VLKAATHKTFHPLISSTLGTYGIFSVVALCYVLHVLYQMDYTETLSVPPTIGSFGSGSSPRDLIVLVWLNLIVNYAVGIFCTIVYWFMQLIIKPVGWLWRQVNACRELA
jgi:hypothetical protein